MPRANRHYIPGMVWHITHRCHKKEFLLKFSKDRKRWLRWLFEAKKRFGVRILNYTVTSNHVHLLVQDDGVRDALPRAIQLVAGRTGQEYNQRKGRKGAFWEDRYHATAVESGQHLTQCLVYIDLNMVRAGVIEHPSEWAFGGHNEIQNPPQRYAMIDRKRLAELVGMDDIEDLANVHREWVEDALSKNHSVRDGKWSESIAVGSESFMGLIREKLGVRAMGRKVVGGDHVSTLKEPQISYGDVFTPQMGPLSAKNTYFWRIYDDNSI